MISWRGRGIRGGEGGVGRWRGAGGAWTTGDVAFVGHEVWGGGWQGNRGNARVVEWWRNGCQWGE